jgi:hypothetical protein
MFKDDDSNSKTGDWSQYQRLVLHELQRLNKNIESVADNQKRIDKDLEVVKVKAAFLGSMGGLLIVIFDTLVNYLKRM